MSESHGKAQKLQKAGKPHGRAHHSSRRIPKSTMMFHVSYSNIETIVVKEAGLQRSTNLQHLACANVFRILGIGGCDAPPPNLYEDLSQHPI